MLIDINANIGHWPFRQTKNNSCKALVERMDKFGIDVSVVSNMNGIFYKDTQSSNEELYEEILSNRQFRNRFISFAIVNPIYAGWENDLEICDEKMGMKGVRLYPKYHDYELTNPACIELVKKSRDRGLVVAFTLRMVDSRPRSWMDINKEWGVKDIIPIIKEVPDAKYLVLNVARGIDLNEEDMNLIKNTNIVFDTSGRDISNLYELINIYGKDKFAFGTHSPIFDYVTGLLRIESLRENEVDKETRQLLKSGNAKRILEI